jgi:predicted HicB family RNase H-like nuclease
MKDRDCYLKIVEWSEEDQCYIGEIPGWIGKCCHGKNETVVYDQLCTILDDWIAIYKKDGIPLHEATANKNFSGKFQLRPGSELHKILAIRAKQAGLSLNSFCINLMKESLADFPQMNC